MKQSVSGQEASLEGDGFKFVLRAIRYERPDADDYHDRNWVLGEVEMTTSRGGRFNAAKSVSFLAPELTAFVEGLRRLDSAMTGDAGLSHLEEEYGLSIHLDAGSGTLTAFVHAHVEAELQVEEVPVDQSHIRPALCAFEALAAAFPVR